MPNDNEIKNKVVQTYAEDMAQALQGDSPGLIKKIIHGEAEHEKEKINLSPQSRKNRIYMFLSLVLILISALTFVFFLLQKPAPTVHVPTQFKPLIFSEKSSLLEVAGLAKDDIAKHVLRAMQTTTVKKGAVEGFYLTIDKIPVGLREFIDGIDSNFTPGETNLVDDNFLLGVYKDENPNFFMLIKMRSMADVFQPMRDWENKIFFDLHGFFGIDFTPDTKYLLTKNFENGIVENKNARILYDENGQIVIAYIFADDNSLIITGSGKTAHEIILRLASSEIKK